MVEKLLLVPETDSILYTECENIDLTNPQIDINQLSEEMKIVMEENNGIGLAAPQVGIPYKIFIMVENDTVQTIINPEIIEEKGQRIVGKEGCLSFPALQVTIKRPEQLLVKYVTPENKEVIRTLDGWTARCFNHETDHVYGITIKDRASKLGLKMADKRRQKLLNQRRP